MANKSDEQLLIEKEATKQVRKNPDLKVLENELRKIKDFENKYRSLTEQQRWEAMNRCRKKVSETIHNTSSLNDEEQYKRISSVLNSLLPEVYALVSLTFEKVKSDTKLFKIRDTQLMTGVALHYGSMVELGTGEGKTYAGVFPAVLNALTGKGVHVITSNDYLAERDFEDLKPIFDTLGLTSTYIPAKPGNAATEQERKENISAKKEGYQCDICFGSNSTFAFDYLFDSIEKKSEKIVQRKKAPFFALIDEADDTLFDAAQIPYIISTPAKVYRKVRVDDYARIEHPEILDVSFKRNMKAEELARLLEVDVEEMINRSNLLGEFDIKIKRESLLPYEMARIISERLYSEELQPEDLALQEKIDNFIANNLERYALRCEKVSKDGKLFVTKGKERIDLSFPNPSKYRWSEVQLFNHLSTNPYNQMDITKEEEAWLVKIRSFFPVVLGQDIESNPQYALTSDGEIKKQNYLFYHYLLDNPDRLEEIANNIRYNPNLKMERDFTEDSHGLVNIEFERFNFVIGQVPSLARLKDAYLKSNEYNYMSLLLDTGLKANFQLIKNKDYVVDDSAPGRKPAEIKLIIRGRAEEGRTFSDGLHEAIGLKERRKLNTAFFKIGGQNKTSASISQKAYFSRYSKKAGMTGTTPHEGYVAKLYDGMYVVKMPRTAMYEYFKNKFQPDKNGKVPRLTRKAPEEFTDTDDKKYELILRSIVQSKSKRPQQPTLITTTSLADSEALANYLQKHGFNNFALLNAKTDPKLEAAIIAQAGIPGAVTISTEMAGRGTDIKLGGDRDKLIEFYLEKFYKDEEALCRQKGMKPEKISKEQRENDIYLLNQSIQLKNTAGFVASTANIDEVRINRRQMLHRKYNSIMEIQHEREILSLAFNWDLNIATRYGQETSAEQLRRTGTGLKVILSGHFDNKRIDEQAEGRQNRGGYDGGVVEYYSSQNDLLNIGIDSRIVEPLISTYCMSTKEKNESMKRETYKRIMKQIARAQNRNDEALFKQIEEVQDLNLLSSAYRNKIRNDRLAIVTGEEEVAIPEQKGETQIVKIDYQKKMDNLIDETIRHILVSNIRGELGERELKMTLSQIGLSAPSGIVTLDRWKDLDDKGMDGARFVLEIEGAFGDLLKEAGVAFDSSMLNRFSTVEHLMKELSQNVKKGLATRMENRKENLPDLCRTLYTAIYDKSSEASLTVGKDVELQDRIYKSMQNQNYSPILAFVNSMNGVMRGMQQDVVGFAFGRTFDKQHREIFDLVRDAKAERSQNEAYLSDENRRVLQSSPNRIHLREQKTTALLSTGGFVLNKSGVLSANSAVLNNSSGDFAASTGGNRHI